MEIEEQCIEHKKLHKKIYDCKCKVLTEGYCNNCISTISDFMKDFGAGVLTQDMLVEQLRTELKRVKEHNISLNNKVDEKTQQIVQLKNKLTTDEGGKK